MPSNELQEDSTDGLTRRDFLAVAGIFLAGPAAPVRGGHAPSVTYPQRHSPPSVPGFELEGLGFRALADGLRDGRWSSQGLVSLFLDRIDSLDRQGPALRHVLEPNPDAPGIALALDEERREGRLRGPLHGIPVLLKDNIDTGDRMTTTAGSLALEGSRASRDAGLVQRLRAAGAIPLAKTSMSEWANFRSTRSSSGWCSRGGQGRNPYVLDRTPCGSSSGTGGGVAAGYAPGGVGTETDGSVTCPAATMGLVGIKPTVGLVSRSGIIPISVTQDTAGPMCLSVEDAALLLSAMTGPDPRDGATAASGGRFPSDPTRLLDQGALKGRRIGVTRRGFTGYHPEVDARFEDTLDVFRQLGAEVVDPADLKHDQGGDAEYQVLLYEFKAGLNEYLSQRPASVPVRTLADVIAFNERERDRVMPYFGQEILVEAEAKGSLTSAEYRKALKWCRKAFRDQGIDATMDRLRLDALVAPTGNPAWPIDLVNGDHFTGSATTPAAVAGYPHVTVPMGFVDGLPVGVSFYGRAWSDPLLVSLAFAYEQATRHRQLPRYLHTLDLGAPR
jgi:amidase